VKFRVRGEDGRDAGSAIAFGLGSQLERLRRVGRFDVVFRLEENRWNGTIAPQLVVRRVFAADVRFDELRSWLVGEYEKPDAARDPAAAAIFEELGPNRRHLLESERFRALLDAPALARAA